MHTGWKKIARTLADRDDALNNMLVEIRTSNHLKHNDEGTTYTGLKQLIQEIKLPVSCFNPEEKVHRVLPELKDDFEHMPEDEGLRLGGGHNQSSTIGESSCDSIKPDAQDKEALVGIQREGGRCRDGRDIRAVKAMRLTLIAQDAQIRMFAFRMSHRSQVSA